MSKELSEIGRQLKAGYVEIFKRPQGLRLPSTDKVVQGLQGLFWLIFPFNGKDSKTSVEKNLKVVYELFLDQLLLAFLTIKDEESAKQAATETLDSLFSTLPEIQRLAGGDMAAAYERDPASKTYEEIIIAYPGIRAITGHRIAHELYVQKVPLIPRIICEHMHSITGIDIHPGASIGRNLFIDHGTGVVIGETSIIGDNVTLYQGVTLGAVAPGKGQSLRDVKRHPTLEDNVTIYAEATLLGDVTIGTGSTIGGNVWLKESVAAGTRVRAPRQEVICRTVKKS